jgi:uncharacterized protein (TIGR02231 family)
MKKLLVLSMLITIAHVSFAINETLVSSKIKNVTVFLNGAQVFRKANINLKKGITDVVFDSISSNINSSSIQVKGKGNYTILDTKYKLYQPTTSLIPPAIPVKIIQEIQDVQDSLDMINFDLEEVKFRRDVLELEKQLLIENKSMKSDSLPLLIDAMKFFREKYNNINSFLIKAKKDEYLFNKMKQALQKRLNKINASNAIKYVAKPTYQKYQIVVTVSAEQSIAGTIDVNYLVNGASWSPKYDLRASGTKSPVELTYKANVFQNSGENWDNVKLKLSTNNPNRSRVKPVLPVWYLNYYNPNHYKKRKDYYLGGAISPSPMDDARASFELKEEMEPAKTSAYYATMNENLTNIEFDISIPYTIPSDGQKHMVAIKNEKLDAKYQYYMVPKLDQDAFLVANIKGFEELSLLPAAANIYFEGTFIGETMLNPDVMGDSLAVTLGRDERISIRRKLLKKEEKGEFLGDDIMKTFTYELSVKNNRPNNVDIIIEDQIPVPNLEEIKVLLLSSDKAAYVKNTGMLSWTFNLPAKQKKLMEFKYSVKYDKDKQLVLK